MQSLNYMEVEMLMPIVSNHSPIQVNVVDKFNPGSKPLKFHGLWLNNHKFMEILITFWYNKVLGNLVKKYA